MDIDSWSFYYKIVVPKAQKETTQMVYEPKIDPDNKIFCMNFNVSSDYQQSQYKLYPELYTDNFISKMFEREVRYLEKCRGFFWSPEIIDIDKKNRRIFFKWYGSTCNDLLFGQDQDEDKILFCVEQYKKILQQQLQNKIYKISLYPHCHYLTDKMELKTFDFYACCSEDDRFLSLEDVKPLLGDSAQRFISCVEQDKVDLKLLYQNSIKNWSLWPYLKTEELYEEFFGE